MIDLDALLAEIEGKAAQALTWTPKGAHLPLVTPAEAHAAATRFVTRELDRSRGHFGRFLVQALRDGLPLRICASELPSSLKAVRKNDWRSFENYLDVAAAYFGYFGIAGVPEIYRKIPAFPDRNRPWIAVLPRTSKRQVAAALAAAMTRPGRSVTELSRMRRSVELPHRPTLDLDELLAEVEGRHGSTARKPADRRLTMLSMGGGRDSVVMALVLANYDDPWLKRHFPTAARDAKRYRNADPDLDLLATFSDTGAEYDFTYSVLDDLEVFLSKTGDGKTGARHPYKLVRINKPHDPKTGKLIEARAIMQAVRGQELKPASLTSTHTRANQWWSHAIEGESAFEAAARGKHHLRPPLYLEHVFSGTSTARDNASCTDNQKIVVLDRFVQDLASERFGIVEPWRAGGRRTTVARWSEAVQQGRVGRHRRLIGIHAGERGRTDLRTRHGWPKGIVDAHTGGEPGAGADPACTWERRRGDFTPGPSFAGACYADATNEYHYPLVNWGIDETDEAKILDHYGWGHTRKSGCMHCHWANRGFFWATSKEYAVAFEEAVAMELGNLLRRWIDNQQIRGVLQGITRLVPATLERRLREASGSGINLWTQLTAKAGARGLKPIAFARAIRRGELPLTRPTTLISRSLLVCEVAHFAIHEPNATVADVFDKAYKRSGGAVNRHCPTRTWPAPQPPPIQVAGFSQRFLRSTRT